MDELKPGALTDAALDRELDSLLAVEPSPEFLARVRARVGEEPTASAWRLRWEFAAAAGVAVAVIVTAVLWRSSGSEGPMPSERAQTPVVAERIDTPDARQPEPEQAVTSQASAPEPLRRNHRPPVQRAVAVDSDRIVVAPEDARAFDRLLVRIRQPDVVMVLNEDRSGLAPLSAPNLPNDPIVIEPVPVAPLEGGVE